MDFASLLQYEPECVFLDFKGAEYKKDFVSKGKKQSHEDFIKDVMSMANSHYTGDRYIVIGVLFQNEVRYLEGIENMSDSATYQQIINANIEPDIDLSYEPYLFEGKTFGIFIISDCIDRPYLMKKDYGLLRRGEGFIRKGTTQMRLSRADYDKIYEQKTNRKYFSEEIKLVFQASQNTTFEVKLPREFKLPSENFKEQMQNALNVKRTHTKLVDRTILNMPFFFKSIEDLEKDILTAEKDYLKADLHYIFEEQAHKFNLEITNKGKEYLTDGHIKVFIPKVNGLQIADKIYHKMNFDSFPSFASRGPNLDLVYYPTIVETNKEYIIESSIGDVKHHLTKVVFDLPVRMAGSLGLLGQTIDVRCVLFAKNLKEPIEKVLTMKFV
jgi:hypothetical protein